MFNSTYNSSTKCLWYQSQLRTNLNSSLFYNNAAKLPTNMKARVIDKEVNAAWIQYNIGYTTGGTYKSTDKVWLLTYTEMAGHTVNPNSNFSTYVQASGNDGEEYDYFKQGIAKRSSTDKSGLVRGTYDYFWLATGYWLADNYASAALTIFIDGSFGSSYANAPRGTVPAVRVQ